MASPKKPPPDMRDRVARIKLFAPDRDGEERAAIRARMAAFWREPEAARAAARVKAEWLEFPKTCPRGSCRRHGRCATPLVVCRFERGYEFESWIAVVDPEAER